LSWGILEAAYDCCSIAAELSLLSQLPRGIGIARAIVLIFVSVVQAVVVRGFCGIMFLFVAAYERCVADE